MWDSARHCAALGEDDVGGDLAALRVYTNIGVCFFECVAGPAAISQPITIDACRASCPDFPPQTDLDALVTFLGMAERPRYPGGTTERAKYRRGSSVFAASCASCHDTTTDELRRVLSNDEMNSLQDLGANATNACRALGTNWDPGKIWANFTSAATTSGRSKAPRAIAICRSAASGRPRRFYTTSRSEFGRPSMRAKLSAWLRSRRRCTSF